MNPSVKKRLDDILVEKGLAPNKSKAKALIMAGLVKVIPRTKTSHNDNHHDGKEEENIGGEEQEDNKNNSSRNRRKTRGENKREEEKKSNQRKKEERGKIETKAGTLIPEDAKVELIQKPHPYVSRGGLKLEKALEEFNIDVQGKICLDAGASTGGFTHCLLLKGAKKVYAVDVGYGQLDLRLRQDERVVVIERCNVRYLSPQQVPEKAEIITGDLSFISLEKVMEKLMEFLVPGGIMILLIKPQFEAEPKYAKKGVVRDHRIHEKIINKISDFALNLGLEKIGVVPSPILGPQGNKEFLSLFQLSPSPFSKNRDI